MGPGSRRVKMSEAPADGETIFAVQRTLEPIYTGGKCETTTKDGKELLFFRAGTTFTLRDPVSGAALSTLHLEEEDNKINIYTLENANTMISCNSDNVLEVWDISAASSAPARTWKGHVSPILIMTHHLESPLLATGSADHGVRVWDSSKSYCTHNFKGVHGAIITALIFHPNPRIMQVISAAADGSIAIWDLHESQLVQNLKGSHVSAVTSLSVSLDGKFLLSAGRDQVVNIWDLTRPTSKPMKTLAIMESIEAAGFLENGKFYTAGEKGVIKIWDMTSGSCLVESERITREGHSITQVKALEEELVVVTSDLFIHFFSLLNFKFTRMMVGHHGEITDAVVCGSVKNFLALSTNSPEVCIYNRHEDSLNCHLLKGHREAVVTLAANESYLISGSRDHTAIIWKAIEGATGPSFIAQTTLFGHTDVVSGVALVHHGEDLAATASADMTIKMWRINQGKASLSWTIKAHEKDINSLLFTPNDKLIVSASQDKSAKIWKVEDGTLMGTLKGHKRGVWNLAISPTEQLVATASADRTIKLWSLIDYSCLKTLEGHTNSVLKIQFICGGTQIVSAGSDGLIKVWDIRKGECLSTIDGHADRVWSLLTADNGKTLISGDAGGILKIWRDVTEEQAAAALALRDQTILKEQSLTNMIVRKEYTNAAIMAMQLEQPFRLFTLLGQIVDGKEISEALSTLCELFRVFDSTQITKLLSWVREWNTSLKRAYIAQLVLHVLLKNRLLPTGTSISELLAQIQPYTERHFGKIDELVVNSFLIDFVVDKIK